MDKIAKIIASELQIRENQVESAIKLIDEGNTIPFIARYRKEATGGLSDEILRDLGERLTYLRNLEKRKEEVKKYIEEQGKLTEDISKSIEDAITLAEVEDIYRPYKPKKKTRATVAKAKGLEPLANIIMEQTETKPIEEIAKAFVNVDTVEKDAPKDKVVANVEEAIQGALDIIAEDISDNPKYRKKIKGICYREGVIATKATKPEEKSSYDMYYDFADQCIWEEAESGANEEAPFRKYRTKYPIVIANTRTAETPGEEADSAEDILSITNLQWTGNPEADDHIVLFSPVGGRLDNEKEGICGICPEHGLRRGRLDRLFHFSRRRR